MRILISAYACEPNKGSEQEVGWRWALNASKEYDKVIVLTRKNNRQNIETEIEKLDITNIDFKYFDLPKWASFWKKGGRGIQLYSYLWEVFSFFYLKKFYKKNEFDVTQRVTFVSYRFPSFLWYFGRKFVLGPVAGGERFPLAFLKIFSWKGRIKEVLRIVAQRIALIDPLILLTLYKSNEIIAVTDETKSILPYFAQQKCIIKPAISIDKSDFQTNPMTDNAKPNDNKLKLLYVGRLLEWKGLMLTLEALNQLPSNVDYVFNIIGTGPDRKRLEAFSKSHNLDVNFLGLIKREKLSEYYLSHDLFVFPSLHDSGGMVVLEAKAHNLKVLVSNFGGPKQFTSTNDVVLKDSKPKEFIKTLSEVLIKKDF